MKIKRTINGQEVEIELTTQERFAAFQEQQDIFDMEDIDFRAESEEITLTPKQKADILHRYQKSKDWSDDWSYSLDYAFEEVLNEK